MKLQLLVKAENLPTRGLLKRRPNAFAVVSKVSDVGSVLGVKRHRLARTEVIPLSASPEWACVAFVSHDLGTEQRIAVDIFHTDNDPKHSLNKPTRLRNEEQQYNPRGVPVTEENTIQLCGNIFDVETILNNKDFTISEPIKGSKGKIHVRIERSIEIPERTWLQFQFRGYRLTNTRLNLLNLDRPDFYFEISRKQEGVTQNTWTVVYRSSFSHGTLNPLWPEDSIDIECLCNNDIDRELQISILDVDAFGKRTLLGSCETTLRGLLEARAQKGNCDRENAFRLARTRDMKRKEKRGELIAVNAELTKQSRTMSLPDSQSEISPAIVSQEEPVAVQILPPPQQQRSASLARSSARPTFESLVGGGSCSIEMCVAIDFSTANGDYQVAGTPHYRSPGSSNDYQWAMSVVGYTLQRFSTTQEYPMWGFGAKFDGKPYRIFQCGRTARAKGVEGLLDGYETMFRTGFVSHDIIHYGDVVRAAASQSTKNMQKARQNNKMAYTVLFVLTAGSESDLLSAKKDFELASDAPLSIVFISIDNGTNQSRLKDSKINVELENKAFRPLCSFVECKEFSHPRDAKGLSEEVTHTLKPQLESYFEDVHNDSF